MMLRTACFMVINTRLWVAFSAIVAFNHSYPLLDRMSQWLTS